MDFASGNTISYTYDAEENPVTVEASGLRFNNIGATTTPSDYTLANTFNVRGELIQQQYAPSYLVNSYSRSLTDAGFARSITIRYAGYIADTSIHNDDYVNGRADSITGPDNGVSSTVSYDVSGRLVNTYSTSDLSITIDRPTGGGGTGVDSVSWTGRYLTSGCVGHPALELSWRQVADRRVASMRVIPAFDEIEDRRFCLA
jgi:hypothetical protein